MPITCQSCKTELPDTAKFCLNCGADVTVSAQGIHPVAIRKLLNYINEGDIDIVENMLRQYPHLANVRDTTIEKRTALHYAAWADNVEARIEMVQLLLDYGADVNARTTSGETPLHFACGMNDNLRTVCLLIEHGANIHARSRKKETPLQVAHQFRKKDIVMHLASQGADVNVQDSFGDTPLQRAKKELARLENELQFAKDTVKPPEGLSEAEQFRYWADWGPYISSKREEIKKIEEKVRDVRVDVSLLIKYGAKDEE